MQDTKAACTSLETRLLELQTNSSSKDCQISDLTARLTAETYRARKAEGDLRKASEESMRCKEANQDLQDKLASMAEGSRGMQNDLDRLEGENMQLLRQVSQSQRAADERDAETSAIREAHEHALAVISDQRDSEARTLGAELKKAQAYAEAQSALLRAEQTKREKVMQHSLRNLTMIHRSVLQQYHTDNVVCTGGG